MPAQRQDLIFEIGADGPFPNKFAWSTDDGTLVDLTGATIKMEIRPKVGSEIVVMTLSTADDTITIVDSAVITLNVAGADITDDLIADLSRSGTVTVGVIEADSDDIVVSAVGSLASYDLKITQVGGAITRLLHGDVCFSREITQ